MQIFAPDTNTDYCICQPFLLRHRMSQMNYLLQDKHKHLVGSSQWRVSPIRYRHMHVECRKACKGWLVDWKYGFPDRKFFK